MRFGMIKEGRGTLRDVERAPEFSGAYDIAVVGLGTAGAPALEKCVSLGRKCLGIERAGGMGGQATVGCISWGSGAAPSLAAFERTCAAAEVAYDAVPLGVWLDGGKIVGLRYARNGIVTDVKVGVVLDATGNATVAKMCGLPVRRGRDFDGVMATCARGETWVDRTTGAMRPEYCGRPESLAVPTQEYSGLASRMCALRHATWKSQTKRKRMVRASSLVNAREEERAVTEEIATFRDALCERKYANPIMYAWEPEDLPVFYGDHAFESEETQNWKVLCGLPMFGYPSAVPYGSLVAKGVDNLLVPSKHFGVSHDLGGALRMQGEMRKSGIAAACAAHIMLSRPCAARDVPYSELQPLLKASGTLAPARKSYVTTYHGYAFEPYSDEQAVEALRQGITRTREWWQGEDGKSKNTPADQAAYALWTCWKRALTGTSEERRRMADILFRELGNEGPYAGNFAVALGLMGDRRAIPMLRRLVMEPGGACDPVVKGAYPNRVKAILLLGRFADAEIAKTLKSIVLDNADGFMKDLYGQGAWKTPELCRFQALSYALMALKSILAKHPDAAMSAEIADWQAHRAPSMVQPEGVDLRDRLRHVSFKS